jgi:hypothetical protein
MQMGTYKVQIKKVLSWLVRCACRAGTGDFYPDLAALVSLVQNIFFLIRLFPHHTLFQCMCPHRPATWAASRAGPPVTECGSLSLTEEQMNSLSIISKIAYVANVLK